MFKIGSNLGSDSSALSISLGDTTCEVTSLSDNGDGTQTAQCNVGMPLGGAQRLYVNVDGLGDAERSQEFVDVSRDILVFYCFYLEKRFSYTLLNIQK